jgi:hypothetical protein
MEWNSTTIPPALFDQTRIFPQWPISARSVPDQCPINARSMMAISEDLTINPMTGYRSIFYAAPRLSC